MAMGVQQSKESLLYAKNARSSSTAGAAVRKAEGGNYLVDQASKGVRDI
jgi:hypothetical protein